MNKKYRLCIILLICIACLSCVQIYFINKQEKKEKGYFSDLRNNLQTSVRSTEKFMGTKEETTNEFIDGTDSFANLEDYIGRFINRVKPDEMLSEYIDLYKQNDDIFGWVKLEGTVLDYPVMWTSNDYDYYTHRNFEKKDSYSGTPFMDYRCFYGCGNYLLHGHNMKNGTMFAEILNYKSEDYWNSHKVIKFDTLWDKGEWDVISVFYADADLEKVEDGEFKYYLFTDLRNEDKFNEYLLHIKDLSLYETGIDADFGDEFLTLSTCSYHTDEGRFVVVARKHNEGLVNDYYRMD